MTQVIEDFVEVLGVGVQGLIKLIGEHIRRSKRLAEIGKRLAQVGAIFADGGVEVSECVIGLGGGLAKIIEQGRYLGGGIVQIGNGRVDRGPILVEHASHAAQAGGNVGAIFV